MRSANANLKTQRNHYKFDELTLHDLYMGRTSQ